MNRLSNQYLVIFLTVLLLANLALFFPLTTPIAALLLIAVLPGTLWAILLCPSPSFLLQFTLASALSYTLTLFVTLTLHYMPGALLTWQLLLALNGVALIPVIPWYYLKNNFNTLIHVPQPAYPYLYLLLLLPAMGLRGLDLGYSEFQGDESLVMIAAAEALSGHEDALFLRSKGPAEVLMPMALWRLTGTINETLARLPFAWATIGAMITLYLIGGRLKNETVGLLAAVVLGYNGFMVAFGRIVQYQGMVVWFSSLAWLMLAYGRETRQYRWFFLSGLFVGSGLLAHYDTLLVLPALIGLGWSDLKRLNLKHGLITATLFIVGVLCIAAPFYLPYSLDPQANRTGDYLGERIGQELRNNLPAFFHFNSFYSSFYAIFLTSILVLGGLLTFIKPGRGVKLGFSAAILMVVLLPSHFDTFAILPFAALAGLAWFSLPLASLKQALVIWLAVPFLGYNFVVALGLTHIYTIVPAWSLMTALALYQFVVIPLTPFYRLKWGLAGVVCSLATLFLWNNFIRHDLEYRQDYPQAHLDLFWTPYTELPSAGFFGFAHRAGWKAVGQAILQGDLVGDYGSNEEPEITTWYTRGAPRACDPYPEFYFMADDVIDPVAVPDDVLQSAYDKLGQIRLANGKTMHLYQRQPAPLQLGDLDEATLATQFDQTAWPEAFARSGRGAIPTQINFNHLVKLVGYDLDTRRAYPNGRVSVTLYWQALAPISKNYQVFVHLEGEHGLAAQADGVPVCWTYPTDVWRPGQIIADQHAIMLPPNIPATTYRLEVGWYLPHDFTRLDWLDEAGNPAGTSVILNNVTIK